MSITFEYEWQAIEFAQDCKGKVVIVRDGATIRFPAYKLEVIAQLLLSACKS